MKIGNREIKISAWALGIVETLACGAKKVFFFQFKDGECRQMTWVEGIGGVQWRA